MVANKRRMELGRPRPQVPPIDAARREALKRSPEVTYREGQGYWTYRPSIKVIVPVDVLDLLGRTERYAQLDQIDDSE